MCFRIYANEKRMMGPSWARHVPVCLSVQIWRDFSKGPETPHFYSLPKMPFPLLG